MVKQLLLVEKYLNLTNGLLVKTALLKALKPLLIIVTANKIQVWRQTGSVTSPIC